MGGTLQVLKESSRKCPIHQIQYEGICGEKNCFTSGLICLKCQPESCIEIFKHKKIEIDEFYDYFFRKLYTSIDFKKLKSFLDSANKISQTQLKLNFSQYKDWEIEILRKKLSEFEIRLTNKVIAFQEKIITRLREIDNQCKSAYSRVDPSTLEPLNDLNLEETMKFIITNANNLKLLQNRLKTIKTYSNTDIIKSKQKDYESIIYTTVITEPLENLSVSNKIQTVKNKLSESSSNIVPHLFVKKDKIEIFSNIDKTFNSNPCKLQFNKDLSSKSQKNYTIDSVFSVYIGYDNNPYLAVPMGIGANSNSIDIINLNSYQTVTKLLGHTQHIFTVRHFFNRKTSVHYLLSTSNDKKVKVWNVNNYTCTLTMSNCHSGLYLYSSLIIFDDFKGQNYVITSCPNEYMKMWDFITGKHIRDIGSSNDYTYYISVWNNDKTIRIINANGINIKIYNTNEPKSLYREFKSQPTWHMSAFAEKWKGIWHLFESDGNGYLRIWKIESGELYQAIQVQNCNFRGLCFWSEKYVIVASSDKGFKVFDIETGTCAGSIVGHTNVVCSVQKFIHPKFGECLISAAIDGMIKLWSNPINHKN